MYYYDLALPLNINRLYTYRCNTQLERGCRVLVNFNNNHLTGIVWSQSPEPDMNKKVKFKDILEVVDQKPLLSEDLLNLAEWMSSYYLCSLGTVIMAMLPTAIQIQIALEVRFQQTGSDKDLSAAEQRILALLSDSGWLNISRLRDKLQNIPLYKHIEHLEELGLIEVKRIYDRKIKKKFANFIILTDPLPGIPELTVKQQEAWQMIERIFREHRSEDNSVESAIPLARLADNFSYSVIKALRHKGLIRIEPREIKNSAERTEKHRETSNLTLTTEQEHAYDKIKTALTERIFKTFLIYGVTGSGKTEVYIRLIKECLSQSRNALILVPEIALTPQMEERFYNAFGENIAILHSHRNERERWEEWKRIKHGESRIVLGARSAVFAPLENIGIIIVDEEHEGSYKQDKNPRYNARDLAVFRGRQNNAAVVLGSATPSLESWYNIEKKKYELLQLTHRPLQIPMPTVTILNMKEEEEATLLSELLKEKILDRLERQEQIILFQNRRGFASYVICLACGKIHRCPHCDVSLIYHSEQNLLMCHYCGHREKMYRKCPECGSYVLEFGTAGTQQLEQQLRILFPSARLLRMDADTTSGKDSYNKMFRRMREGSVDILFGTQMIAKGLDFANVTLVGVISEDNSLNIPDFRSTERTFQLLTQVAGRSGRGSRRGEVIIQTYNPEHYAIVCAEQQDFDSFVTKELETRKALNYPPYVRNARIVFSHNHEAFLKTEILSVKPLINVLKKHYRNTAHLPDCNFFDTLGPVATPIHRINKRFRYHIIFKSDSIKHLLSG